MPVNPLLERQSRGGFLYFFINTKLIAREPHENRTGPHRPRGNARVHAGPHGNAQDRTGTHSTHGTAETARDCRDCIGLCGTARHYPGLHKTALVCTGPHFSVLFNLFCSTRTVHCSEPHCVRFLKESIFLALLNYCSLIVKIVF